MSYQASGTIRCWKKYDCVGCGAVYRHRFSRAVSGSGGTAAQAEASAQQSGLSALRNQVDTCPCPECGRVQPRMVGHAKNGTHAGLIIGLVVVMALVVILGSTDVLGREVAALMIAGAAGLGALFHLWCAGSNPNANLEANKSEAAGKVAKGEVEVLRAGDASFGEPPAPLVTKSHLVYFVFALVAVGAAFVPVAVRLVNGWTLSDTDPPVLGPGDKFRITFPDKIDCVASTWSGIPKITFEGDSPAATVISNNDSWGTSMSVKSSQMHTSPTLWADVTLPNDARLANKELRGRIDMAVSFPQASGPRGMSTVQKTVTRPFTVQLATPYAWQTYRTAWWGGLLAATLITVLAGWGFARLASGMKWDSPPDLVEAIDAPPSDQPREDDRPSPPANPWDRK